MVIDDGLEKRIQQHSRRVALYNKIDAAWIWITIVILALPFLLTLGWTFISGKPEPIWFKNAMGLLLILAALPIFAMFVIVLWRPFLRDQGIALDREITDRRNRQ